MKTAKSIGKARNARLNRARKHLATLSESLKAVEGTPHDVPLLEAEFWEVDRELVAEIAQCFHEANAYNNALVTDGTTFDRDVYEVTGPSSNG